MIEGNNAIQLTYQWFAFNTCFKLFILVGILVFLSWCLDAPLRVELLKGGTGAIPTKPNDILFVPQT
jgi:hypothetical protein